MPTNAFTSALGEKFDDAFPSESSEQLLLAFADDPDRADALYRRLHPQLVKVVPYLAADVDPEEVVQQMWLKLVKLRPQFDPTRATAFTYLKLRLRNAITEVRDSCRTPDRPCRPRQQRKTAQSNCEAEKVDTVAVANEQRLPWELPALSMDMLIVDEFHGGASLQDYLADPNDQVKQADNELYAEHLLASAQVTAPSVVSEALELVYKREAGLTVAAKTIGVDRFKLRRMLDAWRDENISVLAA